MLPESIAPVPEPVLSETAVDLDTQPWIAGVPEGQKPRVVWVRSIWGRNDEHAYNRQTPRAEWGIARDWYVTHPRIAWFKGRMIATFIERDLRHAYGNTVVHIITSDQECRRWQTVAHFPARGIPSEGRYIDAANPASVPEKIATMKQFIHSGLSATQFCRPAEDRLILTARHGDTNGSMMAASSHDGTNWTEFKPFITRTKEGKDVPVSHIFQLARHRGRLYGLARSGGLWTSTDGINFEEIRVEEPADGEIGDNETASTFLGERWIVWQRNGQISSADPPYTRWEIDTANATGPHSHGGPDAITLPSGQTIFGCRDRTIGDGKLAVIYRYDGKKLQPILGLPSGGSMTGYPGLTYADGHLYVSFLQDRSTRDGLKQEKGQFCLAKVHLPAVDEIEAQ